MYDSCVFICVYFSVVLQCGYACMLFMNCKVFCPCVLVCILLNLLAQVFFVCQEIVSEDSSVYVFQHTISVYQRSLLGRVLSRVFCQRVLPTCHFSEGVQYICQDIAPESFATVYSTAYYCCILLQNICPCIARVDCQCVSVLLQCILSVYFQCIGAEYSVSVGLPIDYFRELCQQNCQEYCSECLSMCVVSQDIICISICISNFVINK